MIIDIYYTKMGSELSNLYPREFTITGVPCASMEGFLQSLKFKDPEDQARICLMSGFKAKKSGANKDWWSEGKLYWKGGEYDRFGIDYQNLLDIAYCSLFSQCNTAKQDLIATGDAKLTHSIGNTNQERTILTVREFISRLEALRDFYRAQEYLTFD